MRTRSLDLAAGIILAISLALPAAGQQGVLAGTVTDAETGGPVPQAQIQILGGGQSREATSGPDGQYRIELPAGIYDLVAGVLGYVGARFENVGVPVGGSTTYDMVLTSTVLALDEIVVSASRAGPEKSTEAPATIHLVSAIEIAERPTPTITDHLRSAPGVDVITTGLQGTNVVLRGFNNLFSGALHLLTYNRAFSTPSSLNLFLDVAGGFAPAPLGPLGYSTRAFGTGADGWSLQHPDGRLRGMRSPFTPAAMGGPGQLLPADPAVLWPLAIGVLQAQGAIDAQTAALLNTLSPTSEDVGLMLLNTVTGALTPASSTTLPDVPPLRESYTESFELGWTGVFGNRVAISGDVYRMKKHDFVSRLLLQTPLILLNGQDLGAFMGVPVGTAVATQLMATGVDPATAQAMAAATVGQLAEGMASIPLAVVSSEQVGARGADLIASYRNVGDVSLWGADLAVQAFLSDKWSTSGTYSWVDKKYFQITDGPAIALNAPKHKGTVGLAYRNLSSGLTASVRGRFTGPFPVESANFAGTSCIVGYEEGDDCVAAAALFDLTAGYQVPNTRATVQLSVNNIFDTRHRSFVGVPKIGRFAMLRVKYDLF